MNKLTHEDYINLKSIKSLEEIDKFIEGAIAFKQIRDEKLWRQEHENFNNFCLFNVGLPEEIVNQNIEDALSILTFRN